MSPAGATHAHAESPEMKQLLSRLSVASAVAVGSSALAQDAVQWRVEDGGNGHWYADDNRPGFDAFVTRQEQYVAIGGHLATVTSAAEHVFVRSVAFPTGQILTGDTWPALGAFKPAGKSAFQWVTGEPTVYWPYTLQIQIELPQYLMMWGSGPTAGLVWTGNGNSTLQRAIIEWSADCNADGVVDYGQILAGELEDTNANNIPDCCEAGTACGCSVDISGNGTVDAVDLAAVLSSWGNAPTGKANADVNRDGVINAIDLAEVLGAWGACP